MWKFNLFHLVSMSPWPLMASFLSFGVISSLLMWFKFNSFYLTPLLPLGFILLLWWRDVSRESTFQGSHTFKVQELLKAGMLCFIFSEVMFFFGFFWAFFHMSLSPAMEGGSMWPPFSIVPINPFQVPLLNTMILLSSGATVTCSHHSLLISSSESKMTLGLTIILGLYFTMLQAMEYYMSFFTISDSVYGAVFFLGTGFHGAHVIIGTLFLTHCFFRMGQSHFSSLHHLGFELAIWYWHFVDVVWLFLFSSFYWWSF